MALGIGIAGGWVTALTGGLAGHRAARAGIPGPVTGPATTNRPADPAPEAPPTAVPTERLPRPRPPSGLYVHVPFCISLCPYCDFVVVAGSAARGPANRLAAYTDAVTAELLGDTSNKETDSE